jgi:hypothetical protein
MRWRATMCYAHVLDPEVLVSAHAISSRTASSTHRFYLLRQDQNLCLKLRRDRNAEPSYQGSISWTRTPSIARRKDVVK